MCLTFTTQAARRQTACPGGQGRMQQRDVKVRAVKAKGSTLENGAGCSVLGLAAMVALAFCNPTARPAGACWVQAEGGGSWRGPWGIDWEEDTLQV